MSSGSSGLDARRAALPHRAAAAVCVLIVLGGCTAVRPRRPAARPASTDAIVGALRQREHAARGMRLSMTVRLSGTDQAPLLPSPAYLAIDEAGGIRLQVLSPFGMTVLDLAIAGDAYRLTLPLRHETKEAAIDPHTLADPAVAVSDRMIVALALMFRPKADAQACGGVAPAIVLCRLGPALAARVTVDDALRPVREEYLAADGRPLLIATFSDYRGEDTGAMPGALLVEDPASGARMAIAVKRVRPAARPAS